MKLLDTKSKQAVVQQLSAEVKTQIAAKERKAVNEFIAHFVGTAYLQEFEGKRVTDIFGYFISLWRFLNVRKGEDVRVEVYNPGLETDGWQSQHTIITVLMKNMPFIVDSVRIALTDRNLRIQGIQHSIVYAARDGEGRMESLGKQSDKNADDIAEALLRVEVDRINDAGELAALKSGLEDVLGEVTDAVSDYPVMLDKVSEIQSEWKQSGHPVVSAEELEEAHAFLDWMAQNSFTFLGYVEYTMKGKGEDKVLVRDDESALGILKSAYLSDKEVELKGIPKRTKDHILKPEVFLFAKSSRRSRVHRPAYADYIVVKRFNARGQVVGERRFLGLYTARVFSDVLNNVPLLRKKVAKAREMSGYDMRDHSGKEFDSLMSAFPRDELFQVSAERLYDAIESALYAQERKKVSVYIREDAFGRFVCVLVYVPRDIFNTDLRLKIQNILITELNGEDIDFNTLLSESPLARTQFNIKLSNKLPASLKFEDVEKKINSVVLSWNDDLDQSLVEQYGEEKGSRFSKRFRSGFNASYREAYTPRRAAIDVSHISKTLEHGGLEMSFYRALDEEDHTFHCKLFMAATPITLSGVMPIFENMGFNVIGESPFKIIDEDGTIVWMHDFSLSSSSSKPIDLSLLKGKFEALFLKVWDGTAENDRFNRLLVTAYLGWRQIAVLRSYSRYMRQVRVPNSQDLISDTLVNHKDLVLILLKLFEARFDPQLDRKKAEKEFLKLSEQFQEGLDNVPNLTEDKILRLFVDLIKATVRTNFYQFEDGDEAKAYISFKLLPRMVPNVPKPVPMFEIFVYSPRIEGVHLRGGRVARGGLRWSDRNEDYRTEVLGLVKAQQVKNAVIVPVGAKGGFVAKQLPTADRDAFMKEGIACYQIFISGLLDVTDNLVNGEVVPPQNTVRHDEDDYYLVVAADKGTATFSDIANQISIDRGHWLGDAFASGGSQGYDHKKMGITAKGGWVSVQRHFKEMGVNVQEEPFTCIGVGDMGGDVFGNGMLLSDQTMLVAAFNHMHIFLDPDPNPKKSFAERKRLFEMPRSSWEDYNPDLISRGGGVFRRDVKSIKLSKQVKDWLGCKEDSLPPNVLIHKILLAKADLLWFGGIGTYVKASIESDADVGDKTNDALRVDAKHLKVKVVGEGANLGMTQRARIEFGRNGGRLNTDFIDNAAGVDCSDHEVNIKILIDGIVEAGDMTQKQRNKLLVDMTDDVAKHVLMHNYRQTQALSLAEADVSSRLEEFRRLMNVMESADKLDRELEFLPNDEAVMERKAEGKGLTRPELSVLVSYVKGDLKQLLNNPEFTSDEYVTKEVLKVFPERLGKKYKKELYQHQLRSEIIATQVANDMVNHMGITFVNRLHTSTGASAATIAMSYLIARDVFKLEYWWNAIEALDYKVKASLQLEMMMSLMSLMRRACRWLIRNQRSEMKVLADLERFAKGVETISKKLPEFLAGEVKQRWNSRFKSLTDHGVPEDLAQFISSSSFIYASLGIIEAKEKSTDSLERVAEIYFRLGDKLDLNWFAQQIDSVRPGTHWQALAREAFREDLEWQQRALTVGLINLPEAPKDISARIDKWSELHSDLICRWSQTLSELKASSDTEFAMYSVALRELLDIAQTTRHAESL